jgi:hypothetical protein
LPDLRGKKPAEAIDTLVQEGFEGRNISESGWQRFRHPDGSEININWQTGRIVRIAAPVYDSTGRKINKGQRIKYDGTEIPRDIPHELHPPEILDIGE